MHVSARSNGFPLSLFIIPSARMNCSARINLNSAGSYSAATHAACSSMWLRARTIMHVCPSREGSVLVNGGVCGALHALSLLIGFLVRTELSQTLRTCVLDTVSWQDLSVRNLRCCRYPRVTSGKNTACGHRLQMKSGVVLQRITWNLWSLSWTTRIQSTHLHSTSVWSVFPGPIANRVSQSKTVVSNLEYSYPRGYAKTS
jgi:hypothetical protein